MRKLSAGIAAVIAAGAIMAGTGVAQASVRPDTTFTTSITGASMTWNSSSRLLTVCDTRQDGDTPYLFYYSSSGSLVGDVRATGGSGTCGSATLGVSADADGHLHGQFAIVNSAGEPVGSYHSINMEW